ncbi:MAG TPA: delta-60 repeat domain-containing protein, partial [Verrucomicrobiae bacterium]|nr:delta-60 repeat domain-containing protein [Verrucomicrobiae bacterium]
MELSPLSKQGRICFQLAIILSTLILTGISVCGQIPLVDATFHPDLSSDGQVYAIVVQTNGSIVIGGDFESVSGEPIANLARLFSDGTLDDSFPTGTDNGVLDLAQQSDGKIVVSGNFTELQGVPCNGLGRLLADGEVDTNFNTGMLFGPPNTPYKLAVRPDGKILVGTLNGTLFQLTTNGSLDANFTQTNVFEGYWAHGMLLETNGDLIVGGGFNSVNGFPSPGWAVLDPAGNLKTNLHSALAVQSDVFTILRQTNGGFLIGGLLKHTNGTADTVLDRLDSNFLPDTTFQTSPFTPLDFTSGPYIRSAILQPDG